MKKNLLLLAIMMCSIVFAQSPAEQEKQDLLLAPAALEAYAREYVLSSNDEITRSTAEGPSALEQMVSLICKKIKSELAKNNLAGIHKSTLEQSLHLFLDKKVPLINKNHLECQIHECTANYFKKAGSDISKIPQCMRDEYGKRKTACIDHIKSILTNRKIKQMPHDEVTALIGTFYEGFIERMDHVLTWEWANASIKNISTENGKRNTSHIPVNKEAANLKTNLLKKTGQ